MIASFVHGIDRLNTWVGKAVKYLVLVSIVALLYEAISRYFFNAPTMWAIEGSQFAMGAYFLLGGGYALLRGAHVRMDIFYDKWSPKKKAIVDVATFSIFAAYCVALVWNTGDHGIQSFLRGEHSTSWWGPPVYPIKLILPVGAFLLLLQGIAFFIRDLYTVSGRVLR